MDAASLSTTERLDDAIARARARIDDLRARAASDANANAPFLRLGAYREPDPGVARERVLEELHDEAARLAIALAIRDHARRASRADRWFGGEQLGRGAVLVVAAAPLIGLVFAATRNVGLLVVSSGFAFGGAAIVGLIQAIPPRR